MPHRFPPSAAWPVAIAVALVGLAFVPSVAPLGIELTELPERAMDPLGWLLLIAQGALVALAGRWPVASLVTVAGAFVAYQLRGYPTTFASLGLFVVAAVAAYRGPRHPRVVVGSAVIAFTAFVIVARAIGSPSTVLDFVSFAVLTTVLIVVAVWLRMQSAQRAVRMRDAEREAVDAERARIARELHDVVTHHVTAMVVQSDALQRVTGDPDRLETGLKAIGETGRSALGDLRDLLQTLALQDVPDREPIILTVEQVVARSRASGQSIELTETGPIGVLSGSSGLTVTRVLQESLTNALKHAPNSTVQVQAVHSGREVQLTVSNRITAEGRRLTGSGRGLAGVRERVELVSGDLRAGIEGDRFVVHARIPV